ncbi:MAG: helix-turn-helix transcriptional regulator [Lachnospiraceae bacterium]|nr:helix-turn-helix transcriptional regulator [Lachnospiraceae bacterium]
MNKDKKKDVGNPPIDIEEFDTEVKDRQKQRIANYIQKAKGEDRSIRKYAEAVGISPAAISKYIKGEYIPSPSTMKKLTSKDADPRNGVSYEDLMEAAGYDSDKGAEAITINYEDLDDGIRIDSDKSNSKRKDKEADEEYIQFEKDATTQLIYSLADKGFIFQKQASEDGGRRIDLKMKMIDQPISEWNFTLKYIYNRREYVTKVSRTFILQEFARALRYDLAEDAKLSFVIQDKYLYKWLKENCEHKLAYRGEMSVILYDMDNDRIVDECYMSNYYKEDQSREIKII